jgi:hypothetical protein
LIWIEREKETDVDRNLERSQRKFECRERKFDFLNCNCKIALKKN